MIVLKNATLSYSKDYSALMDINLQIKAGERVGIVGDHGSGKTALLRLLAGLESLKCGKVYIRDIPIKKVNFMTDISLGYVTPNATFFERKSVYDNFLWILKSRKVPKKEREGIIRAVLEEFELSYLADMKINMLNPLERRQVQVARLALRPLDIILVDDIFIGNDEDFLKQIKKTIKILFNREPKEKTIIMACENEDLIKEFVQKVYHIDGGAMVEQGNEE